MFQRFYTHATLRFADEYSCDLEEYTTVCVFTRCGGVWFCSINKSRALSISRSPTTNSFSLHFLASEMAPRLRERTVGEATSKQGLTACDQSTRKPSSAVQPPQRQMPLTRDSPTPPKLRRRQPVRERSMKRALSPCDQGTCRSSKRLAEAAAAVHSPRTRTTLTPDSSTSKGALISRGRGNGRPRKPWTKAPWVAKSPETQMPLTKTSTTSSKIAPPKKIEVTGPPFMMTNLATEIQLNVLKDLDYKTLLNISATNKHFRALFLDHDKQMYKLALVDFEEKSVAWRTNLTGVATYAPCYGCLKTLSRCHFRSFDWYASSTSTGERAFRRRCATCSCGEPLTGPSRVVRDDRAWLYCEGCKMVTHLVGYESCGVWDHTRGGIVWGPSQHQLAPEISLCRECRP